MGCRLGFPVFIRLVASDGIGRRVIATTSKPAFASSSDTPLAGTASLIAERTRKLDKGFAH